MRPEEAATIATWIQELGVQPGDRCLNIGSSTRHFREVKQPHIHESFVRPLELAGMQFVHCDLKEAEGVDQVGDILDPAFREELRQHSAKLLICSNLLEHLEDAQAFADVCGELVPRGGHALFTVPSNYPYHCDPIDTMLRPNPQQLRSMFPDWKLVRSAELAVGNYWRDLRQSDRPLLRLGRHAARVAMPFYRPARWRETASRLLWLVRTYRISMVLLRRPTSPSAS